MWAYLLYVGGGDTDLTFLEFLDILLGTGKYLSKRNCLKTGNRSDRSFQVSPGSHFLSLSSPRLQGHSTL